MIMALNFWHADFKFVPPRELGYEPSNAQTMVLANLRAALKAFVARRGSSQSLLAAGVPRI